MLENLERSMKVLAEGHLALVERLDRMEARFETRFEQLETRLMTLETKFEARFEQLEIRLMTLETKFEEFAADTRRRLDRIETHLGLDGPHRPAKRALRGAPKRRKAA